MPIRPEHRHYYRKDWHRLALKLRTQRAGNVCECAGLCGGHDGPCGAVHGETNQRTGGRALLTCAHLHQDPRDHDPAGLLIMCQSCHLRYDRSPEQRERRLKVDLEIAGQMMLPELQEQVEQETNRRETKRRVSCWLRAVKIVHRSPHAAPDRAHLLLYLVMRDRNPMTIHKIASVLDGHEGWSRATIRRRVAGRVEPVGSLYDGGPDTYDPYDVVAAVIGKRSAEWVYGYGGGQP